MEVVFKEEHILFTTKSIQHVEEQSAQLSIKCPYCKKKVTTIKNIIVRKGKERLFYLLLHAKYIVPNVPEILSLLIQTPYI